MANEKNMMTKKTLRLALLIPISIICNSLFLFIAVMDFRTFFHREEKPTTGTFLRFTEVRPNETPLLFLSFLVLKLVILIDTVFILLTLCEEGKKKLPVVGGSLIHHVGTLGWIMMIITGALPYNTGITYCLFLLEFCFPLRALVNLVYVNESDQSVGSRNRVLVRVSPKVQWQLKVFMLDMFMSGGGAFAAIFIYLLILSDETLDAKTKNDVFFTYLFCILFWFVQLGSFHRASQNRLIGKVVKQAARPFTEQTKDSDVEQSSEVSEQEEVCNVLLVPVE